MVRSTAAAIWVLREYVTDLAPLRHVIDKCNRDKPGLHQSQLIVEQLGLFHLSDSSAQVVRLKPDQLDWRHWGLQFIYK